MSLIIAADENIPHVEQAFESLGQVRLAPGRALAAGTIKNADVLLVRSVTRVDRQLLAGSAVGVALMDRPERIGGHYAANLIGSGAGAALVVPAMFRLSTFGLLVAIAAVAYFGAVVLLPWRRGPRRSAAIALVAALAILLPALAAPREPAMSEFKMLSQVRRMPKTEVIISGFPFTVRTISSVYRFGDSGDLVGDGIE